MPFNFDAWKQAVLVVVEDAGDRLDLLVASGLIEADTLEEAFEEVLRLLEADVADEKRRDADGATSDRHG